MTYRHEYKRLCRDCRMARGADDELYYMMAVTAHEGERGLESPYDGYDCLQLAQQHRSVGDYTRAWAWLQAARAESRGMDKRRAYMDALFPDRKARLDSIRNATEAVRVYAAVVRGLAGQLKEITP